MVTVIEPAQNKVYNEDITITGENIIGCPCVVFSITLTNDSAAAGVVNLSDSTTYSNASRVEKAAVGAGATVQLTYPRGLPLSNGLSAAVNVGSIDIAATYD